jgi:peptidoglycan/LPS O-acetylase OafA/YrhL
LPSALAAAPARRASAGDGRVGNLDGLRAIAAGLVFLLHAFMILGPGPFTARNWRSISWLGPIGVAIFFAISGFVLYRPYVSAAVNGTTMPGLWGFWLRRMVRIFPAYWVALAAYVAFDQVHIPNVTDLITFAGLLESYRSLYSARGLVVSWTLVVEVSFYLTLPLFAACCSAVVGRHSTRPRVLKIHAVAVGILFAAGLGIRVWDIFFRHGPLHAPGSWFPLEQITFWLPGYLHWFAAGMAVALVSVRRSMDAPSPSWVLRLTRRPGYALTGAAILLVVAIATDIPLNVYSSSGIQAMALTLIPPLFGGLVLSAAVFADRRATVSRMLSARYLVWAGTISYGIYLWHRLVLVEVRDHTFGPGFRTSLAWTALRYIVAAAGTLLIAAASYYALERPLNRLVHRGGQRNPTSRRAPTTRPQKV